MIGTTLGHYRIVRALGRGGMGEVYAAEDLRLHRLVALKVLRGQTALDPERLQRFHREAEAVAALNHPNVVTLFGFEEVDGIRFLAMELVEGKTFSELIPARGFPPERFLKLAVQVADAVSAAHQRGIIHRDLKPANVMLGPDDRVKVLDFGLAKLKYQAAGLPDAETLTAEQLTTQQAIMGTPAYMSPEQAEGGIIDTRSDIFSLGVLFYEMATGGRPFRGDSAISLISSIIKDSPPAPSDVNRVVSSDVDRIIRRCLAKDPARRYQSATDLRNDLEELQQAAAGNGVAAAVRRSMVRVPRPLVAMVAALIVVAIAAYVLFWRGREPTAQPGPVRAEFSHITSLPGVEWFPSLSPDGKWVVYGGEAGEHHHIYLQSVSGQNRLDLSGDSQADDDQPAFSPDGERIAFRSSRDGGGIFVMGRTGEAARHVTRMGFRPSWSPDGTKIVFATENVELNPQNAEGRSELWIADVATGAARRISEENGVGPSWSPHNLRIAYTRRPGGHILTIPVAGGTPTPVTNDKARNWGSAWSPDGNYIYYASDRGGSMNLWRVAIDEASGRPRRDPEPITTPAPLFAQPSLSADGRHLAYTSALITGNIQRLTLDPATGAVAGEPSWLTTGSSRWSSPDPSPDGQRVVFYSLTEPEGRMFIARADGTEPRQLTPDSAPDRVPRWSPDGQWIACFSPRSGPIEIWRIRPDGSDLQQLTGEGGTYLTWAPDGSRIAAAGGFRSTSVAHAGFIFDPNRLWKQQTPERIPPFDDQTLQFRVNSWSPDGARLVGQLLDRSGALPRGIATWSLRSRRYDKLTDSGEWPVWFPDSRHVLFVANGNAFYVVDSRTKRVQKIFSVSRDVLGPPRLTRDGRAAYFSRRITESDIWLVTLK